MLNYSWSIILSFISREIVFLLFSEARETGMGILYSWWAAKTQNNVYKKKCWLHSTLQSICWWPSRLCVWLGVVAHCCCPAWWKSIKRVSYLIFSSLGKDQTSKFKVWFPTECALLSHHQKGKKNCKLNHFKWGGGYLYTKVLIAQVINLIQFKTARLEFKVSFCSIIIK